MKTNAISELLHEAEKIRAGRLAPARVWKVTRRPDGTVERRQVSPAAYQAGRARKAQPISSKTSKEEAETLTARRKLGVSQDRFAELLEISPATVRNWEQGRRKPTGPAKILIRLASAHPEIMLSLSKENVRRNLRPSKKGKTFTAKSV